MMRPSLSLLAGAALAAGAAGCLEPAPVYYAQPAPVARPVVVDDQADADDDDDVEEESAPASVDVFYDRLSPYGEWVEIAPYGRVWRPYPEEVGEDFVPYGTGGTWVNSDAGWTFRSRYRWGWAAYHYGRWFHDDARGWFWTPDTVWGPAWVDWRYGDDYIGWAPLGPPGVVIVERNWAFVETRHFGHPHMWRHVLAPDRVHVAFTASAHTSAEVIHGGVRWYGGPPVEHVTRVTGRPVRSVHVNAPAAGTIRVYRPAHPSVSRPPSRPSPRPSPRPAPPGRH